MKKRPSVSSSALALVAAGFCWGSRVSCGESDLEDPWSEEEKEVNVSAASADDAIHELQLQARLIPEFGTEEAWQASMKRLRKNPAAIDILAAVMKGESAPELSELSRQDATFIMGHMKDPRAIRPLMQLAQQPLQEAETVNAAASEQAFKLRLRAIYGLERLGAIDGLLEIRDEVDQSLRGSVDSALAANGHPMHPPRPLPDEIMNFRFPEDSFAHLGEALLGPRPSLESTAGNVMEAMGDAPLASAEQQSLVAAPSALKITRSSPAGACGVSAPKTEILFKYSFWCTQNWINYFWKAYHFSKEHWDNGMGYEAPCNYHLPLGRTFNTIQLLNYSMKKQNAPTGIPTTIYKQADQVFYYGDNYTIKHIKKLTASCSTAVTARTYHGPFVDQRTILMEDFFYGAEIMRRAAVLVHEARHASGCSHNGNDGSNKCRARSDSCDESISNGCAFLGSAKEPGAVAYHVLWLLGFLRNATPYYNTTAMRGQALEEANTKLIRYFDDSPCFTINKDAVIVPSFEPECL